MPEDLALRPLNRRSLFSVSHLFDVNVETNSQYFTHSFI